MYSLRSIHWNPFHLQFVWGSQITHRRPSSLTPVTLARAVESGGVPGRIRCVRRKLRTAVCGRSRVAVVMAIAIARRAHVHS